MVHAHAFACSNHHLSSYKTQQVVIHARGSLVQLGAEVTCQCIPGGEGALAGFWLGTVTMRLVGKTGGGR